MTLKEYSEARKTSKIMTAIVLDPAAAALRAN